MHTVLTINASSQPAIAALVELEGKSIRILARETLQFPGMMTQQPGTFEQNQADAASDNRLAERSSALISFREMVARYRDQATTAALIVPPLDYISLNLSLPFSDQRTISRILPMEVQDLVPFEVSEFVIHSRRLRQASAGQENQIHVGLMPKVFITALLETCRAADFEPMVFCTPTSCLGAGAHLAPRLSESAGQTLLIHMSQQFCSLLVLCNGAPTADRSIDIHSLPVNHRAELLFSQIQLSAASFEKQLGLPLDRACLIGNGFDQSILAQHLQIPLEHIGPQEFPGDCSEEELLPVLGAVFAAPVDCPPALCDFRTGEFAYRPQFFEIVKGLRRLAPWFAALAFSVALVLALVYWIRGRELATVHGAIAQESAALAPSLRLEPGSEIALLGSETEAISRQLAELGSDSRLTPLRIFSELSQNLGVTKESGIFVKSIRVKGNRVTIEGEAPDYAALDRLETNLKKARLKKDKSQKRRKIFCEVKRGDSSASFAGASRAFSYSLRVCETETGTAEGDEQ